MKKSRPCFVGVLGGVGLCLERKSDDAAVASRVEAAKVKKWILALIINIII